MNNLLRNTGTTVLNLKLVDNKGGFDGVRGLNYAYVTLASYEPAVVIEKLNMQSPLHLGVAYKPSEEERRKMREQQLLDMTLGSVKQEEDIHAENKDVDFDDSNNNGEHKKDDSAVLPLATVYMMTRKLTQSAMRRFSCSTTHWS